MMSGVPRLLINIVLRRKATGLPSYIVPEAAEVHIYIFKGCWDGLGEQRHTVGVIRFSLSFQLQRIFDIHIPTGMI